MITPGIKTTEFWTTLATAIATIVVSVCALFGHVVNPDAISALVSTAGLLGANIAAAAYAISRSRTKVAAITPVGDSSHISPVVIPIQPTTESIPQTVVPGVQ